MPHSYAEATNKVFQERRFEADGSRDVSGIVEEVGPGPAAAGQFKKGDEVFAMADPTRDGGLCRLYRDSRNGARA
jgi:NADPH:quinone reductase-like Zn-dependent oxidoreductase